MDNLQFKIDEVLSICDSEIEELMLLQLFDYFQNYGKVKTQDMSRFSEVEFIEEEICLGDPDSPITENEKTRLENKIKKYNYRFDRGFYYKNIGFKVKLNFSEPLSLSSIAGNPIIDNIITREFAIYPQSEVTIAKTNYRIDIAIILNREQNEKIIDTRKIALECDGYDYHSSAIQKMNDDKRTRKLKINGWKDVFRYSGKEIYQVRDIGEVHYKFEEIITMLMI
ncbi:hypothetical protein CXF59_01110 [Flavobacterium sp. ALD4]|nr:hypothetical protein CXF59_01110 [Flavobacterium sp. ALD4]